MENYSIKVDKDFKVGEIDKRLFGSFIEHMGRVIYTGVYEPDHPTADENGFRQDVLELVKNLNLGVIRYPGGNFTSAYDWEETIGPKEERKTKLELAWKGIETNQFGLNEFFEWMDLVKAEPILTVNLGTKGIDDARNIIEYCNFEQGTYWSDLRREHGREKPYDVKLWCLGNELDGHWQVASKSAQEYGRLANETSKVMKLVDESIETILVGSSTPRLKSYPTWDRVVLENCYENVDFLSLHNYINRTQDEDLNAENSREPDDTPTYLARSLEFDRQIEQVVAVCDYVKALKRSDKTMYLAFDEWNVHKFPEREYHKWQVASPIDWAHYTMEDTLLFASMGLAILRRADRIKISCQSLLVNTIPLILTDENGDAWCNPTYYVMEHLSHFAKGNVLQQNNIGPTYDTEVYKNVEMIDSCIVENGSTITIFIVNRGVEAIEVGTKLQGYQLESEVEHIVLSSPNLEDINAKENPKKIVPSNSAQSSYVDDVVYSKVDGFSWNVIRVNAARK